MWMWCLHKVDELKPSPQSEGHMSRRWMSEFTEFAEFTENLRPPRSRRCKRLDHKRGLWGDGTWFWSDSRVELIESGPGQLNRDLPTSNWANSWSEGRKMSLQHQLAPTDQMFHKSSSVTSISDFKLQILMRPTTVSQIRSNNPGISNCGLPQCITASLYCTAAQWSHLLLLQTPCPFFCLFLSVSVCFYPFLSVCLTFLPDRIQPMHVQCNQVGKIPTLSRFSFMMV